MLAGHVEDPARAAVLQHLLQAVEFIVLRQVREVAGVNEKFGGHGKRVDPRDRLSECRGDILVRRLAEADVTVADLDEVERAGRRLDPFASQRLAEGPPGGQCRRCCCRE